MFENSSKNLILFKISASEASLFLLSASYLCNDQPQQTSQQTLLASLEKMRLFLIIFKQGEKVFFVLLCAQKLIYVSVKDMKYKCFTVHEK